MLAVVPQPMLARLESKLPRAEHWRYEPKFDGFRGLLWRRTETGVELLSRNMPDLSPWFPELVGAGRALPVDTLVDGEIVIADEQGRSDFTALQQRLTVARRAAAAAIAHPAVLLVFDVLALSGSDLRDRPLVERRQEWRGLLPIVRDWQTFFVRKDGQRLDGNATIRYCAVSHGWLCDGLVEPSLKAHEVVVVPGDPQHIRAWVDAHLPRYVPAASPRGRDVDEHFAAALFHCRRAGVTTLQACRASRSDGCCRSPSARRSG